MNDYFSFYSERLAAPPRARAAAGRKGKEIFWSHVRRLALEAVNFFFCHDWLFWLIGRINRLAGFIESVFLVYPANEEYALAYVYRYRLPKVRWRPWPCGLLWQNQKLGLMFCISASNGQFTDPANAGNVRRAYERMERLQALLVVKRKTFAGILPGILFAKRIIRDAPEADLTAEAVAQAVDLVKAKESLPADTPVIVLGGKGFIGRRVVRMMYESAVYSIDSADGQGKDNWPNQLSGRRVIVVNVTLNNSIRDYVDALWSGTVVINEVYPEPDQEILGQLSAKGCHCYHVVGVEAKAFPAFPLAYNGAIPCCAAWPSKQMKVVVRKLI